MRQKHRKLFLIGESHMRYKFGYIVTACYKTPFTDLPMRNKSVMVENVHYRSINKMLQYRTLWEKHLKNEVLGQRDMVIVQTGAHGLAQTRIQHVMGKPVKKLVESLGDLR